MTYDHRGIESKWQKRWLREKTHEPDFGRPRGKGKFYNLMMFPYPSAEGLHVGNVYAFTGADIFGRFQRMRGFDVFEPIGLDGFGIHSENYAIKMRKHPADQAKVSEKNFYRQLSAIGNGFAWAERLETYDPEYYRWTQWIFTEMFRRGLAYRKKQAVNWCPSCKTVLADEQVISGECERCGAKVVKRDLEQWFFKITNYAERLLKNLDTIDWSERIKIAQKNWIGRSEGAAVEFEVQNSKFKIPVFTTRPDTLFGATYMVLAPEHQLISKIKNQISNIKEVEGYIKNVKAKTDEERIAKGKEKTGVELQGIKAINPANGEEIPVWVADYVLGNVGTGAIMAVPAHDERDFEFARKFDLPVIEVVRPVFGDYLGRGLKVADRGELAEPRKSVFVVIQRNTDGKFLILRWKQHLWVTLPHGGIDPGETAEQAAEREALEETGYSAKYKENIGGEIESHFFADHKDEWRIRLAQPVLLELVNETKQELSEEESMLCEAVWLSGEEALKKISFNDHRLALARYLNRNYSFTGGGILINSGQFDGMDSEKAKWEITKFVGGQRKVQYRLRDWLISRQRYWGPPIPMIFCEKCQWQPVPERDLPVKLPYIKNFRPTGTEKSPLALVRKFYKVRCPKCKSWARRETDVSDTFLDSAWYYLRYPSTHDAKRPWDPAVTKKWFPVDMYTGGAEHAVLHLLYVRFLAMAFYDWGLTHFEEPFKKFRAHGLIIKDSAKMSKSRGNVVNPDEYVRRYGADALRMYLMFLGPFEQGGDFRDTGIRGITRFLERVWKLFSNDNSILRPFPVGSGRVTPSGMSRGRFASPAVEMAVPRTTAKVTDGLNKLRYNTAISALMILLSYFEADHHGVRESHASIFLRLLAPFAPHITEELWHATLGAKTSIHRSAWPEAARSHLRAERIIVVIQVNGRVRDRIEVEPGSSEDAVRSSALARPKVREWTGGKKIKNVIYVPGRVINIVLR